MNLSHRIDTDTPLTEDEITQLTTLLCQKCHRETKERFRRSLSHLTVNYGIFRRVELNPVAYTAGQDYREEIRTVRNLILKG